MCTRIRAAIKYATFQKLIGEVEADETWIGGKDKEQALEQAQSRARPRTIEEQNDGDRSHQPEGRRGLPK